MLARRTSRALFFMAIAVDALGLVVEAGFQAVHFHDEHRPGIERKAEMERRLDRLQDQAGRAFPGRAGMMPAPMMSLMVLVASSTVSKTPSRVRYASGIARDAHPDLA